MFSVNVDFISATSLKMKLLLCNALILFTLFNSGICGKSALVIIDVQYSFLPGGSLAVKDGDQVVPVINSIRDQFDVVAISQDWHCPDHVSFASQHPG